MVNICPLPLLDEFYELKCVATQKHKVFVCVCVCVHVYVVYEDTNLYNDMGMT